MENPLKWRFLAGKIIDINVVQLAILVITKGYIYFCLVSVRIIPHHVKPAALPSGNQTDCPRFSLHWGFPSHVTLVSGFNPKI